MIPQTKLGSPIIVAGMLRSGTSLTAGWLSDLGINLGQRLMPPGKGNEDGYFEDLDFVEFHENLLKSNNTNYLSIHKKKIEIPIEFKSIALEILKQKKSNQLWGWKVPMTTLVLNFWYDLLPNAKFILVYRDYSQVIYSLLRWEKLLTEKKYFPYKVWHLIKFTMFKRRKIKAYLYSWIKYNQEIISFVEKIDSSKFIVIKAEDIYENEQKLIYKLQNDLGINIMKTNAINRFKKEMFSPSGIKKSNLDKELISQANEILIKLDNLRVKLH